MRQRPLLIGSIMLNLVLAAVVVAVNRQARQAHEKQEATGKQSQTNAVKTVAVLRKQFFSWEEVESADYATYIKNLRDIGCPEQTIRDIVVADVNQLYAKRRLQEVNTPEQEWWRSEPDTNFVAAVNAKIAALDLERRNLLVSLLGPDWEKGTATQERQLLPLNGPVLGDMPAETKKAVRDIISRLQERVQAYADARQAEGKPADPLELARMRQEATAQLAKVLNPAQLEEFMLRYSPTAGNLRRQLRGFDATPDEFRSIFRARESLEDQLALLSGNDPDTVAKRAALQKQLDDSIKSILPPDRYKQYLTDEDPAYQDAVAMAKQAGAPDTAVQALYEINKATLQEKTRIQNDPTLSDDEKAARLKAIDDQQQAAANQLLGIGPAPMPPLPPNLTPTVTQVHPFAPGETVETIAARYGVTPASIVAANPNLNLNVLSPGTPIKIQIPQGK